MYYPVSFSYYLSLVFSSHFHSFFFWIPVCLSIPRCFVSFAFLSVTLCLIMCHLAIYLTVAFSFGCLSVCPSTFVSFLSILFLQLCVLSCIIHLFPSSFFRFLSYPLFLASLLSFLILFLSFPCRLFIYLVFVTFLSFYLRRK